MTRKKLHTRHRKELPVIQGQSESVDHHHHVEREGNQTPESERSSADVIETSFRLNHEHHEEGEGLQKSSTKHRQGLTVLLLLVVVVLFVCFCIWNCEDEFTKL